MQRPAFYMKSVLLGLSLALTAHAGELTLEQRQSDFDQLVAILKSSYSMVEYKKKVIGVDLEQLAPQARARIATLKSDDEFYDLLTAFVSAFRDGHTSLLRPSNMSASLGFRVKRASGKAILSTVSQKALPADVFPFKPGDELVSMDGVPVAKLVRDMIPFESSSTEAASLSDCTRRLTVRYGVFGRVPTGICRLEIKPAGSGEAQVVQIPWIVKGRALPGLSFYKGDGGGTGALKLLRTGQRNPNLAIFPGDLGPEDEGSADQQAAPLPPWAPSDAVPVPSPEFPACMFNTDKGMMGYVRINSFSPDIESEEALKEFRRVLGMLKLARGIIVDVNDNPGGSVTYGLSLAAMFSDRMLQTPTKSELANRTTLTEYRQYEGSDDVHWSAMAKYHADEIEKAMQAGLSMTPQIPLAYRASQAPDPEARFTGPVLVLTNENSVSMADMFPSVLKDNKVAKTFGMTTAGAGGSVGRYGPLAYSGCTLSCTVNITQRVNGAFIENVGTEADIPYEITQKDIATRYSDYKKAYVKALTEMIQ